MHESSFDVLDLNVECRDFNNIYHIVIFDFIDKSKFTPQSTPRLVYINIEWRVIGVSQPPDRSCISWAK